MGFEIDKDDFRDGIIDAVEDHLQEYVETEVEEGHFECDCGGTSFDIETWTNADGEIEGAAVCRSCNTQIGLEVDTSQLDSLR